LPIKVAKSNKLCYNTKDVNEALLKDLIYNEKKKVTENVTEWRKYE